MVVKEIFGTNLVSSGELVCVIVFYILVEKVLCLKYSYVIFISFYMYLLFYILILFILYFYAS